ncbi:MAG TPA: hypothetical protein VJJ22_02345 [Candidatus Paceibacterota bacterium]
MPKKTVSQSVLSKMLKVDLVKLVRALLSQLKAANKKLAYVREVASRAGGELKHRTLDLEQAQADLAEAKELLERFGRRVADLESNLESALKDVESLGDTVSSVKDLLVQGRQIAGVSAIAISLYRSLEDGCATDLLISTGDVAQAKVVAVALEAIGELVVDD